MPKAMRACARYGRVVRGRLLGPHVATIAPVGRHDRSLRVVISICTATLMALPHVFAAPLSRGEFTALAARCAPAVAVGTLEAVAVTESNLNPLTLHDNTTGRTETAANQEQAVQDAARWVGRGDSVDIGLMQINSMNFSALGLTIQTAFDPCASLAAGASILSAAYGGGQTNAEQQAALLMALSRYNTGSPFRGIMNGYARRVLTNAGADGAPNLQAFAQASPSSDPNLPPSWNVSANGVYAESHGAPWLVAPLLPARSQ